MLFSPLKALRFPSDDSPIPRATVLASALVPPFSFRHTSAFVSTTMFRAAAAGPFDEVVSEYPADL